MAGIAGPGSALLIRAKEARARAQAADAFGITSSSPTGMGVPSTLALPNTPVAPAQPVVSPASNPNLQERMFGVAETFLSGLHSQLYGEPPRGTPPVSIAPGTGIGT